MYRDPKKQHYASWRSLAKTMVKCLLLQKYVKAEEVSLLDQEYNTATVSAFMGAENGASGNLVNDPMNLISLNFDGDSEEYHLDTTSSDVEISI